MSSADFVVAVDPLTGLLEVVEAALVLPFVEVTEGVLRTGVVLVVPATDLVRVVEAVGEVTFLPLVTVPVPGATRLVEGTVDFLAKLGVVEVVEVTEVLLATLGVAVARVGGGALVVGVMPGVLEARTVPVGLVAVEPTLVREVTAGFADAVEDLVIGVFEVVEVALFTGEVGAAVPARPAAAKEDIRLFTLGVLSDIKNKPRGWV